MSAHGGVRQKPGTKDKTQVALFLKIGHRCARVLARGARLRLSAAESFYPLNNSVGNLIATGRVSIHSADQICYGRSIANPKDRNRECG